MGGYGSGRRPYATRPTIGATNAVALSLDELLRPLKRELRRKGLRSVPTGKTLDASLGTFTWSIRGEPFATVAPRLTLGAEHGTVRLTYAVEHWTGRVAPAAPQLVELVAVPWAFGGRRWHFVCPLSGRHCRILYLPAGGKKFASRGPGAYRLVYDSQNEDLIDRGRRWADRLRRRLGAKGEAAGRYQHWPDRPPRMRQVTYERILTELQERDFWVEDQIEARFVGYRWLREGGGG